MGFVPGSNVLQVNMNGTYLGVAVQNTLYFSKSGLGSITLTDAENLRDAIIAWWTVSISNQLSSELTFHTLYMTDLTTQTSPVYEFPVTLTGQVGSPAMPGSVTLAVSFITAGRGRSSRGRNYIIGLAESTVSENAVSQLYADNMQGFYEDLITAAQSANFIWIVFSRITDGGERLSGLEQPVLSCKVTDLTVDTQRRRLK